MQTKRAAALRSATLLAALAGLLTGQSSSPSITLTSPSLKAWETEQSSIDLEGTARSTSGLSNVLWVNQLGKRGVGEWTPAGGQNANWAVQAIPLRLGLNQIMVTAVDSNNHSASVRVVVNRVSPPGTQPPQPLPVRAGTWQNRPIAYQVWNGMAVVEGDIILAPETSLQSGQAGPAAAKQGIVSNGLAINYTSQFWPAVNGVHQVPYVMSGSSSNLTTAIDNFNAQFSGLIQFVGRTNQANYVNITVESNGSGEGYSNVGMAGGEQTLDCGGGCVVSTWLHEMGHTVGLLHEHQRPDRGSFITLNLANADLPNVPGNFTLFTYDYQTIGLYDYASIMHYGAFDFTNAGLPVIESIPRGIPLGASSSQTEYSTGDIDQIERLYGATPSAVTATTNPPGLQIMVDGVTYTAPHTFSWALNSEHTLNLPADPQTANPSDGSTYAFGVWNDLGARSHSIIAQPGNGALASPANKPAVTVYEANFIRLQPFAFLSPSVYPSSAGTLNVSPSPTSEYGGSFYTDRTLVTLTLTPTQGSGYNFYGWSDLPYPPSDNPHSFYDQAPTTQAQAVFVSTPVTIVGESLTGPNTWNPGLAASVDGNFTYLPSAFSSTYNGSGWNAGTTHSISVDQQQSPVTTNIFYNWNSWSDAGAITHNIVQPSTGSQAVSASFTPFYAFYTIPAALGSSNASCYGGMTTSPAGTPYSANTAFDFYEDGTSVTATATANSQYSGMVFAGWSGSLSGNTNPQTTTIHNQFVPTANFNTVATPITITDFSLASVAATSSAMNITINGTGFTSSSYVYWNGSYRTSTYVSSTQLTMHLNAGDLANAGGQDVFVGNYVTNSSNSTCGVGAESTFTVTNVVTLTPVLSVTPNPATGLSNTFALAYSDPNGAPDLNVVEVIFNSTTSTANSCYAYYYPASNLLYLRNDSGTGASGSLTPGSGTLSNSQCTIAGSGTSAVRSGDTLTLNLAVTASSSFTGKHSVFMYASDNSSASTGWVNKGVWTPAANQPPTVVSATPNPATGLSNTFALAYSDPNGAPDLNLVEVIFNSTTSTANSCYAYYYPASNLLYLRNDSGTGASGSLTPGSGTLSNSQCTIAGSGTSAVRSGDTLTLNLAVTASSSFTGTKNIYMSAVDNSSASTGWVNKGAWTP